MSSLYKLKEEELEQFRGLVGQQHGSGSGTPWGISEALQTHISMYMYMHVYTRLY